MYVYVKTVVPILIQMMFFLPQLWCDLTLKDSKISVVNRLWLVRVPLCHTCLCSVIHWGVLTKKTLEVRVFQFAYLCSLHSNTFFCNETKWFKIAVFYVDIFKKKKIWMETTYGQHRFKKVVVFSSWNKENVLLKLLIMFD